MLTIDVVVRQILEREISGALPLPELCERVSAEHQSPSGGAEVLLREIESRPEVFRVLRPCMGPWDSRGPRLPQAVSATPWVLVRAADPGWGENRTESVLMETLREVGNSVDAKSFTALARWLQLVIAAGETFRALHSEAMNHPERHSSSESTSTNVNPEASVAA
jgi:hypothetical protein